MNLTKQDLEEKLRKWLLDKEEYQLAGNMTPEERKAITGVYDYLHIDLPDFFEKVDKEFESYHKV